MTVYPDNSFSIGHTPLVRLNRVVGDAKATVLAKVEGRNPAYSVKCRVGANLVWQAEKDGLLKPGMELLEASSGNTGIALAFVAAARGYKLTLTMPEGMSLERQKVLKMLGANLLLTDGEQGMAGSIQKAEQLAAEEPGRYFYTRQFENPANPAIHEQTTGPEVWEDTQGKVDAVVASVGTGGTITGLSHYFKKRGHAVFSLAVEPAGSPVISQTLTGKPIEAGPHLIQGIGAGFVPKNLDLSALSQVAQVTDKEALQMARRLAKEEGLLSGISSGAAAVAAVKLAAQKGWEAKTIVCILPDAGDRYVSTVLFDNLFGNF
jgi:cysteine synthase A